MKYLLCCLWWPVLGLSLALSLPAHSQPNAARVDTAQILQDAIRNGDLVAVKTAVEADPQLVVGNRNSGDSPLYSAIQIGKLEIVNYLLEKGADPNAEIYPLLPLITALESHNENWKAIAEALVAKGAKVNGVTSEGSTPLLSLLTGVGKVQKEKVAWLLSQGADLIGCNSRGTNALEAALSQGSSEIAELVIDKVDVKARDNNGATPLFAAVAQGNARYVRLVLDKGADINAQNFDGNTVLHLVAGNPGPMLKVLLDAGAKANLKNHRGDLPLHLALRRFDENESVSRLYVGIFYGGKPLDESITPRGVIIAPLTIKSDVNVKDQFGLSPLLLAILARDQESRCLIIAKKPKLDATTQLFDAVGQGNVVALKTLLAQHPYLVYSRLVDGTTPLHISALWGTLSAAQLLVQKGADVNARDSRAETPLHQALTRPTGNFTRRAKNMMSFLIAKGADVNALDQSDVSPLILAIRSSQPDLIAALLAKNVNVNARGRVGLSPIFALMTKTSDLKSVRALLDKGANVNALDYNGFSVLSRAALTGRKELVQLLLDKGTDVGVKIFALDGNSARSSLGSLVAMRIGDDAAPIAEMLLAKGADPTEKINGEPLIFRAISNGSKAIVRVLLATKKVDLKEKSKFGQSLLMQAVRTGNPEIVSLLLEAGADPNEKDEQGRPIVQLVAK